ncbi:hypothetical protein AN958_00100 [Leucoagaricus sp. SymC.cos]|nr:hypothetical protein AN958_00100 [Leucoagaricus sp. SymC.cos]
MRCPSKCDITTFERTRLDWAWALGIEPIAKFPRLCKRRLGLARPSSGLQWDSYPNLYSSLEGISASETSDKVFPCHLVAESR